MKTNKISEFFILLFSILLFMDASAMDYQFKIQPNQITNDNAEEAFEERAKVMEDLQISGGELGAFWAELHQTSWWSGGRLRSGYKKDVGDLLRRMEAEIAEFTEGVGMEKKEEDAAAGSEEKIRLNILAESVNLSNAAQAFQERIDLLEKNGKSESDIDQFMEISKMCWLGGDLSRRRINPERLETFKGLLKDMEAKIGVVD